MPAEGNPTVVVPAHGPVKNKGSFFFFPDRNQTLWYYKFHPNMQNCFLTCVAQRCESSTKGRSQKSGYCGAIFSQNRAGTEK